MPAANDQLKAADRRLVTVLDAMLVGVVIIDPWEHTIVYANDEAARIVGCQATDLLGHVCHSFICPVVVGKCPITDLRQEIDRSERCVLSRDGRRLPILKTVQKLEFDDRLHYLETFMDITELREKERLQGVLEMAGAATHHLGQPLQVLTTSAALLTRSRTRETVAQLNQTIGRAINQIKAIIANIQNITQYQTEAYINGRRIVDIARSSSAHKGGLPKDPDNANQQKKGG